jgi:hypothetical protein
MFNLKFTARRPLLKAWSTEAVLDWSTLQQSADLGLLAGHRAVIFLGLKFGAIIMTQ